MLGYSENELVMVCPKCGDVDAIHKDHINTAKCFSCGTHPAVASLTHEQYFFLTPDERKEYDTFIREKNTLHSDVFDEELYKKTLEGDFERRLEIETEKREVQTQTGNSNQPKCPICQSTNLSKISTASKVGKIAMFGIFGMGDNGKTWRCDKCGSKF